MEKVYFLHLYDYTEDATHFVGSTTLSSCNIHRNATLIFALKYEEENTGVKYSLPQSLKMGS